MSAGAQIDDTIVKGLVLKPHFLDLPVESRNKATALFTRIKNEMRKGHPLRDLGLDARAWDNVGLEDFLRLPKEHYLKIINSKTHWKGSKKNLNREINSLYTLFENKNPSRRRLHYR